MRCGFGIDVGGDIVRMGCFDENGNLLHKWAMSASNRLDSNQLLPDIADEIERFMQMNHITEDQVIGIGVGIPGPVNRGGTVNRCVNLGWGVFNIDRALSGLTGLYVASSNIANVAALGECWKGGGRGCENMLFVAMNIGIGGAIISNGQLVQGAHGGGGEIGHMMVNRRETQACTCGKKGCLEQYFSPVGIVRMARRQLAASEERSVLRAKRPLTHGDVFDAAARGDKVAIEALSKVYAYVGEMIANVCCVSNPEIIVLGGELCKYGKQVVEGIDRYFNRYVFHANKDVRFSLASLGEDASIYGAFKLVLDRYG